MDGILSLLRSRKVLLALLAVVQSLTLYYMDVPSDVWQSIDLLLIVLISAIAYEDGQQKSAPMVQDYSELMKWLKNLVEEEEPPNDG